MADSAFADFLATIDNWLSGDLGVGLALTAMVIGIVMGMVRSEFMPALIGLAFAALIAFAPNVIAALIGEGSLIAPAMMAQADAAVNAVSLSG